MSENEQSEVLHKLLHSVLRSVFDNIEMEGAPVDYAVVWYPRGRAVTLVNILADDPAQDERLIEAFEAASLQVRRRH